MTNEELTRNIVELRELRQARGSRYIRSSTAWTSRTH